MSHLSGSHPPHIHADVGVQGDQEIDALVNKPSDPPPSKFEAAKDVALVTGRFIRTLLQKLPDVVDGNPAKVALGIAKLILDIRDVRNAYIHWH